MSKKNYAPFYSSEIRGLWLMKLSCKMLQNLQYFCNEKTQIGQSFFIFISSNFGFFYSAQSTVHMSKIAGNEKNICIGISGFCYYKKDGKF